MGIRMVKARSERPTEMGGLSSPGKLRAELRAVVAALEYYNWEHEGWKEIIIGKSSNLVIDNTIEEAPARWVHRFAPSEIRPPNRAILISGYASSMRFAGCVLGMSPFAFASFSGI